MQCFGTFTNAEAAARAYDLAAICLDGEDAVLNYALTDYWDFDTKALRDDLPWDVPQSVLDATPSSTRRKRQRGRGKKVSNDVDDVDNVDEREGLGKASRPKKQRKSAGKKASPGKPEDPNRQGRRAKQ
eukprot:jgi/Ulvmu1/4492/UM002_0218.1